MAMSGLSLPSSKTFALGVNLGFYQSKQAFAVQGAMRINEFVTLNAGVGAGASDGSSVGGRVGL